MTYNIFRNFLGPEMPEHSRVVLLLVTIIANGD